MNSRQLWTSTRSDKNGDVNGDPAVMSMVHYIDFDGNGIGACDIGGGDGVGDNHGDGNVTTIGKVDGCGTIDI